MKKELSERIIGRFKSIFWGSLLCCSDQQLPTSGDGDLQQVTTLLYCLVDNWTIMKMDTGEKLDIIYSIIFTTPPDTSKVIARQENELLENELLCTKSNNMAVNCELTEIIAILNMVLFLLLIITSGYIISMHFELCCALVGRLLILYNCVTISLIIAVPTAN